MAFEPFDLSRIVHQAEAIKGMRNQSLMDDLQRQYLGQRMTQDQAQEGRAVAAEGRAKTAFDQDQQITNTKLLNMAAAEVMENPSAAPRWDQILKSAIPDWSPADGPPEQIQASAKQLYESTSQALQALRANSQQSQDIPSNVREYAFYQALSPQQQQQFLEMKRSLNPYSAIDVAGGKGALDRRTGEVTPLSTAEQEAAGQAQVAGATASAKTTAESQAKVAFDLPRLEQNATQALQTINDLKAHPGLPFITGLYSKAPIVPGTDQAAADALAKQIQGKTFLEAYNTLRGSGQITEIEGEKAQDAIGRLSRAQDTETFQTALDELAEVISTGVERARQQAGNTAAPTGQAAGGFKVIGVRPAQ